MRDVGNIVVEAPGERRTPGTEYYNRRWNDKDIREINRQRNSAASTVLTGSEKWKE